MVIDLVMVTAPKPPGSRQLISPLSAVLEMAPAKVLHGAVRLQGLASSPTPDTQVRVACAWAGAACSRTTSDVAAKRERQRNPTHVPSEGASDANASSWVAERSEALDGWSGPGKRRLDGSRVLASQDRRERASSVPSLTETRPARSGTCFPPARLPDTCRSQRPRRPGWSGRQTTRWPRPRRRW